MSPAGFYRPRHHTRFVTRSIMMRQLRRRVPCSPPETRDAHSDPLLELAPPRSQSVLRRQCPVRVTFQPGPGYSPDTASQGLAPEACHDVILRYRSQASVLRGRSYALCGRSAYQYMCLSYLAIVPAKTGPLILCCNGRRVPEQVPIHPTLTAARERLWTGSKPIGSAYFNSLSNLQVETEIFSEVSEEEICEAVQVAQNASGNGDASDDISELAVEKPPMGKEVLQAASVVLHFSLMLEHTAARKMESALASFTCQTHPDAQRAMKETTITQYFSRQ
ncbi:hypothetical protein BD413DRAFT_493768 [Trametes elegans]|nr:hypothetical protein BD413DRAFT_493768 [Trametes elegans]